MKTIELPPALRQSLIASFDQCPLSTRFRLESEVRQSPGAMGILAARGVLFHQFAARAINHMREHQERSIDVDMAMELLTEVIAQRDVPEEDVVHLPMRELRWLRVLVTKWAYQHEFSIDRVVDVERRLEGVIECTGPGGLLYERTVTGQPDVLIAGPGPEEATILDWKAQPIDAKVLTPSGWRAIGTLAVGDQVIGRNGRPTAVLSVHPQGRKAIYEVEFCDGSKTRCCDEHLWTVRSAANWITLPLSELRQRRSRSFVPAPDPVEFQSGADLPVDPYLLGALLGDGTLRAHGSIGFTSADPEIVASVAAAVPAGVSVHAEARYGHVLAAARGSGNALRRRLGNLGLIGSRSWEKRIPDAYLFASPGDRLELLRGLMDTDGSVTRLNQVVFSSASRQLAEGVQFLVRSLGGRASLRVFARPGHRDRHSVQLRIPVNPFRVERKALRWRPNVLTMDRGFCGARSIGEAECVCIKVEAPDGLYVTDDLIVTHNSGFAPPANKRDTAEGEAPREDRLSDMGYVQQVVYGWLVLKNYPAIQRVTEREYYVMHGEVREASVERWEMERIEDVLAAVVSQMDGAIEAEVAAQAEDPPRHSDRFFPIAGTHCGMCPRPRDCPIKDELGVPADEEEAQRLAHEWIVSGIVRAERLPFLKGYVEGHGPIPIAHAKGRREVGWVRNKTGNGRSFKMYEPDEAPDSPFDPLLEQAAREHGVLVDLI